MNLLLEHMKQRIVTETYDAVIEEYLRPQTEEDANYVEFDRDLDRMLTPSETKSKREERESAIAHLKRHGGELQQLSE